MELSIKQTQALDMLEDASTNEILYGGGAGGGKSILGCYWLLKSAVKYPKTRWLMGRAVLKTLKETTLNSFWKVCDIQGIKIGTHVTYNDQKSLIKFWNGSEILLKDLATYPTDPNFDELGSLELTGGFVDECNQISKKAWNIARSRIRHNVDKYGLVPKMLGTCNPDKGWIYSDFYLPAKDGLLEPKKAFIKALVDDNPDIDKNYRENLLSLDKNSKERLLYGNFEYDDDPALLIDYNRILDLFTNGWIQDTQERYISADVARFGTDKTVVAVWQGWRCQFHTYSHQSIEGTVNEIQRLMIRHQVPLSNVVVDEDGVGGGVVDYLDCPGFVNNSSALPNPITGLPENYRNLKSQCYYRLADQINKSQMYVECDDSDVRAKIIQELEQVKQYHMDKDMKREVLPKDKVKEIIGRSPDYSDAMAMRMWFELRQTVNWEPH